MKVEKRNNYLYKELYDILLEEDNNTLEITFGGNGDLYWILKDNGLEQKDHNSFIITKENYQVYKLFDILYDDIKKINIFDNEEIPFYINSYEEYLEELEYEKKKYRVLNYANYNELFNEENKTITWYSDETNHEVANYVTIKKDIEKYIIDFYTQPYKQDYERENNIFGISIRFRNSGSMYDPFNIVFMKMFNKLQEIDDINDLGHQYHIEEYLYNNTRKLNKKRRKLK